MNDPLTSHDRPMRDEDGPDATGEHRASTRQRTTTTLPVMSESVQVEKVEVDRGGYRITKRVESQDVVVDELLRHETIEIERRPMDRQLADGEVPTVRWEGDTMIVPVTREIVVTQKRLVLVEEIRISRSSGTHRDPQSVTVREEQVEIERLEPRHR